MAITDESQGRASMPAAAAKSTTQRAQFLFAKTSAQETITVTAICPG